MKKVVLYQYLGTNGTIISPVHLEDIYYIRKIQLSADANKILTDGVKKVKIITVPENELNLWKEIDQ
jgi:hypothetical protein